HRRAAVWIALAASVRVGGRSTSAARDRKHGERGRREQASSLSHRSPCGVHGKDPVNLLPSPPPQRASSPPQSPARRSPTPVPAAIPPPRTNLRPFPFPAATPRAASLAPAGPLTTQPTTATGKGTTSSSSAAGA